MLDDGVEIPDHHCATERERDLFDEEVDVEDLAHKPEASAGEHESTHRGQPDTGVMRRMAGARKRLEADGVPPLCAHCLVKRPHCIRYPVLPSEIRRFG